VTDVSPVDCDMVIVPFESNGAAGRRSDASKDTHMPGDASLDDSLRKADEGCS